MRVVARRGCSRDATLRVSTAVRDPSPAGDDRARAAIGEPRDPASAGRAGRPRRAADHRRRLATRAAARQLDSPGARRCTASVSDHAGLPCPRNRWQVGFLRTMVSGICFGVAASTARTAT
jgi:hypothetical protein